MHVMRVNRITETNNNDAVVIVIFITNSVSLSPSLVHFISIFMCFVDWRGYINLYKIESRFLGQCRVIFGNSFFAVIIGDWVTNRYSRLYSTEGNRRERNSFWCRLRPKYFSSIATCIKRNLSEIEWKHSFISTKWKIILLHKHSLIEETKRETSTVKRRKKKKWC